MEILLVRRYPVSCNVTLGRGQVEFPRAHHFVKVFLQIIFHARIPRGRLIGPPRDFPSSRSSDSAILSPELLNRTRGGLES
jgi:hypothetical protein